MVGARCGAEIAKKTFIFFSADLRLGEGMFLVTLNRLLGGSASMRAGWHV